MAGAVVVVQIAFATAACKALAVLDLADIGALTRPKVEGFGLYAIAFVGSIYASVMALRKSNVETFIVFRASTPLAVAALDYVFLGRSAPSSQALASLIATAVAASAYSDGRPVLCGGLRGLQLVLLVLWVDLFRNDVRQTFDQCFKA